MTLALIR